MSPVTGPASESGSFLVFTGEECNTLREVLRLYLAETQWVTKHEPGDDELVDEMVVRIVARRAVCERAAR